jgi:hypothetical protein
MRMKHVVLVLLSLVVVIVGFSGYQVFLYQQQIKDLEWTIFKLQTRVTDLENNARQLSRYRLNRPTLNELEGFLRMDNVNNNTWTEDVYTCVNFAGDLKAHAEAAGWNISFVVVDIQLWYRGETISYGHTINGAYLADGSWVFIEPQNDGIYPSIDKLLTETIPEILNPTEGWLPGSVSIVGYEYSVIW